MRDSILLLASGLSSLFRKSFSPRKHQLFHTNERTYHATHPQNPRSADTNERALFAYMSFAASSKGCGCLCVSSFTTRSTNRRPRKDSNRRPHDEMTTTPKGLLFLAARTTARHHQTTTTLCSTSGRSSSFGEPAMRTWWYGKKSSIRSVFTPAALNGQQEQEQQQPVKPVQMPPRLTNNGVVKNNNGENLPPFQSQMATTTRREQQQQEQQQFRSIPPQPLPKTNNNNNSNVTSSSSTSSVSNTTLSASSSATGESRLEGKLLPDDVDAAYHQLQHLGQKWADLHAEAEILEEAKKCILATITLFHVDNGDAKSTAEVRAHASKEYQDHIKKMVEARRLANQAKIELESIKTHLNLVRTFESSRREELKML